MTKNKKDRYRDRLLFQIVQRRPVRYHIQAVFPVQGCALFSYYLRAEIQCLDEEEKKANPKGRKEKFIPGR
jgi:hypothetical protein